MSLLKKILSHSFWLLIGNSIGRLSMFLTNIVAARLLPQETFGQFMMIRSTISSAEGILSGALGSPIIKRVSEISHKDQETMNRIVSALFFTNLIIALCLGIGIFAFSPLLVERFFIGETLMVSGLKIGALLLIATTLSNSMQSVLTGFEAFKKLAFAGIGASVVSLPIIVVLIYYFGFSGAVWGVIIYFISDFSWKYLVIRKIITIQFPSKLTTFSNEGRSILKFSLPLFFSVLISSLTFWYARVIVIQSQSSFNDIAIFDAAYQWLTIIMIITSSTTSVVLPLLSKTKDTKNIQIIFNLNLYINLFISILVATLFIIFSDNIMSLYGSDYVSGSSTLIVLSLTSIFFTLATFFNRYMIAINKQNNILIATSMSAVILIVTLILYTDKNADILSLSILFYYITSFLVYLSYFILEKKYE